MTVLRIVANFVTADPGKAKQFYDDILGLDPVMDHGWIVTYAARGDMVPQVSFASEGGSGTPVPDLSVEVDNLDEIYRRMTDAGFEIAYPITAEPWGVRRFFVKDPFGRLVNILAHDG
jgi:catechol 2,3-dioxygenase-like lactoylglutathione lyase family enzyme